MRKGQVTIFAIIGIVLVVIFTYLLMVSDILDEMSRSWSKSDYVSFDYAEGMVRNSMSACMQGLAVEGVYSVALHGGYLSVNPLPYYGERGTNYFTAFPPDFAPMLLDSSGGKLLSEDEVGKKLCNRIYPDLDKCLDVDSLEAEGFAVSQEGFDGDFSAVDCNATLKDGFVSFRVGYPVMLSREGYSLSVSDYAFSIPYDLKKAYDLAGKTISAIIDDSSDGVYDLEGLCDEADGLKIVLHNREIINITGPGLSPLGLEPLEFHFAVKDYNLVGDCR
ncbi:hypothetical protein JW711_04225 [Candidatus Woesearchaeota archaeon]|nr:hypothetical protein [Candidatus Woesearchaeota archaeon]